VSAAWSLRSRLTGTVLVTVGAVLVALAVVLYAAVQSTAWRQHDEALLARAQALAAIAEHDDEGYEMSLPREPAGQRPSYIEVWRLDGKVLARSASLASADLPRKAGPLGAEFSDVTLPDGRAGRMVVLHFLPRDEASRARAEPLVLVLAEGTEAIDTAVASLRGWFLVLGLAALGAIALVTAWSLGRGLRPLTDLAARIEEIDVRRLTTRLPADGQPAELVAPIHKLNELLARLESSFTRERQFTGDVSHELRTPLAGLRTLLEVTALADRSAPEYAAAIGSALAVVKQLGVLVENLLSLARLDAGQLAIEIEEVALRGLVDDCWKPHAALASSRSLRFSNSVPMNAIVRTDREKLRIVLGNLLANAAEYTDAGGWIEVNGISGGVLEVADSGPAIPDDQIERVFDRLWRGDVARSGTGLHCGIGLSLARALCESLSLSLTVASTTDRVVFRLTEGRGNL
jgi:signal transduction histidine kinase